MNQDIAISCKNLTKLYKMYNNPKERFKEALHPFRKKYHKDFYALHEVSFDIKQGETVGIIGKNGAGKSTLLKIITGVLTPTSGSVSINGKVASLLELGAGFNMELTGIENIYLNGIIMGFTKQEVATKIQEIIAFADIGAHINQPVKGYSSGMFARLAFAVAISVEPDILIVDEALSVGDMAFQAKCALRMKQLKEKGVTIFFVSHSLATVREICSKAIYLKKGKIIAYNEVKKVCQLYEKDINQSFAVISSPVTKLESVEITNPASNSELFTKINAFFTKNCNMYRAGTKEAEIINALVMVNNVATREVNIGQKLTLRIAVKYHINVPTKGTIGYMIQNMQGTSIAGFNIYNSGKLLPQIKAGSVLVMDFVFINNLAPGEYTISVGVKAEPLQPVFLDQVQLAADLVVLPLEGNYVPGIVYVENTYAYQVL